jgi:phospholipid transport system substrate-binding protein
MMTNVARYLKTLSGNFTWMRDNYRNAIGVQTARYVSLAMLVFLLHTANAAAGDAPNGFMANLLSRAIEVLNDKVPLADREERFRQLFQADFASERIAQFVLGPYWRLASAAEQRQFLQLFENYVVLAYSTRLAEFRGESFTVRGWRDDGDGVIVSTDIITPGRPAPLKVGWRLITVDGNFKIVDVIVDGISMMVTERAEFASVIRRNGGRIGGLLALMRQKTAEVVPTASDRRPD